MSETRQAAPGTAMTSGTAGSGGSSGHSGKKLKGGKPPVAKWGAACSACAVAKSKCIRSNPNPGSKCDRCERLFKDCTGQVHRPRKKRQPKPSRTAQLEERLNGLVNILKASGDLSKANLSPEQLDIQLRAATSTATPGRPLQPRTKSHRSRVASQEPSDETDDDDEGNTSNPWAIPLEYNSCAPVSCICRPESPDAPPPPDSDETLLHLYRSELQPLHPFVVIPATLPAAALAADRPFLMAAIRMATSFRSPRSMRSQMYHLVREVSDRVLVRSERSLDLLLGILVMLGWYQYHCPVHAQLSNLIGLAKGLAGELGLGTPPKSAKERLMPGPGAGAGVSAGVSAAISSTKATRLVQFNLRTNEERRAHAGVWYLSSTTALGYGKVEPMRFTRYLDQCLRDLEVSTEYESDEQLVALVRIQHLMERLAQLGEEGEPGEVVHAIPTMTAPHENTVAACHLELDRIRQGLPPRLRSDRIIQTYINTATLRLHEPPLVTQELIASLAQSLHNASTAGGSGGVGGSGPGQAAAPLPPLDAIYRSHDALAAWFDNWLSVPVSSYYCQTLATCTQIIYAVSRLGRWARLVTSHTAHPGDGLSSLEVEGKRLNEALDPSLAAASAASVSSGPNGPSTRRGRGRSSSVSASASSSAPTPGSETSTTTTTDRELCPYNPNRPDESVDPTLPVAVASVQSQLGQFPGLQLDITQIMSALQKRFQDVSTSIQRLSVPAEQGDLNAWSMNAIKLFLTRAKLEHWAELVAEGVEALSLNDRSPGMMGGILTAMSSTGGLQAAESGDGSSGNVIGMVAEDMVMSDLSRNMLMQEGYPPQEHMDMPSYLYGGGGHGGNGGGNGGGGGGGGGGPSNPWVTDMMQNGDASTWFDGYLNWGSVDDSGMLR